MLWEHTSPRMDVKGGTHPMPHPMPDLLTITNLLQHHERNDNTPHSTIEDGLDGQREEI